MNRIEKTAEQIAERVREQIEKELPNSALAESVEIEYTPIGFNILANHYFEYAEHGRGPGKVPRNFQDIIVSWVARKHIQVQNVKEFARAVTWKTIREGSSIYRGDRPQRDLLGDIDSVIDAPLNEYVLTTIDDMIADA